VNVFVMLKEIFVTFATNSL